MHKKKLAVLSVLIAFVLFGAAASLRQKKGRKKSLNLKFGKLTTALKPQVSVRTSEHLHS